jgi:hypothetical protein
MSIALHRRTKRRRGAWLPGVVDDPLAGVSKDATSAIYVPSSLAQWNQTLSAAGISNGPPGWLWLLQEASGALADSIGSAPLTNLNSMGYQGAVTGWSRVAMNTGADGGAAGLANVTDTALPDLSAESSLVLMYAEISSAPAADRSVILSGDVTANVTAANLPKIVNGANNGTGASSVTTAVRPWVLRHNVTATTTSLFTDLEKVTATYGASGATKRIFFGAGLLNAPIWKILYAVHFKGAAAELSDAQLRTLLQRLGWTIAW